MDDSFMLRFKGSRRLLLPSVQGACDLNYRTTIAPDVGNSTLQNGDANPGPLGAHRPISYRNTRRG
jgi:hypothetical protein